MVDQTESKPATAETMETENPDQPGRTDRTEQPDQPDQPAVTPLDDAQLQQWRRAATTGGLPQPYLERWQPLRAGVVNLWEFNVEEYWYAGGWAQLMGRNETGKSSLMALTTLIPWLADTSSDKIDTLGRSGKQFSYYVRPTQQGSDRRKPVSGVSHGWLWVEYGRLSAAGPKFFTTLLYAASRDATQKATLTWCTSEGVRVREGLRLVRGAEVFTAKMVDRQTPELVCYPTAAAYKNKLANILLDGSVDKLELIGKILKVARTPKLGAQLELSFISTQLRAALPALRRKEIDALAKGWDQLDKMRQDVELTEQAASLITKFVKQQWIPWKTAVLRLQADQVANRQAELNQVTRDENEASQNYETCATQDQELSLQLAQTRSQRQETQERLKALRDSEVFQAATQRLAAADAAQKESELKTANATQAAQTTAEKTQEHQHAVQLAEEHREHYEVSAQNLAQKEHHLREQMRKIAVEFQGDDAARMEQAFQERDHAVGHAFRLAKQARQQAFTATTEEKRADDARAIAESARQKAENTWQQAEQYRDDLAQQLHEWAQATQFQSEPRATTLVSTWIDSLPTRVDAQEKYGERLLRETAHAQWYEPHHNLLEEHRRDLKAQESSACARLDELQLKIRELQETRVDPPAPPALWRRRDRSDSKGAPLWRLLDPVPGAVHEELAAVEAALSAMGLLDAWVDQRGIPDELDTFLAPHEPRKQNQPNLTSILTVAEDAGELASSVQRVLESVCWVAENEALPGEDTAIAAVAADGRWQMGTLAGRAASVQGHSEWIGESARAERRRRLIAQCEQERAEIAAGLEVTRQDLQTTEASLEQLQTEFRAIPKDNQLRETLVKAQTLEGSADEAEVKAEQVASQAERARAAADDATAKLLQFCNNADLPPESDALQDYRNAITNAHATLNAWRDAQAVATHLKTVLQSATQEVAKRQEALTTAQRRQERAEQEAANARAYAQELRQSIGTDDAALLAQKETLERQEEQLDSRESTLIQEHGEVLVKLGQAKTQLQHAQADRQVATQQREKALDEYRRLLSKGLAENSGLELENPDADTIQAIRAQCAQIRRTVTPRGWDTTSSPEARQNNARIVEKLRNRIKDAARDLRNDLLAGARELTIQDDQDLLRAIVTVDAQGTEKDVDQAVTSLAQKVEEITALYDDKVRETLDQLLGSTFLEHMRAQIAQSQHLVESINQVLSEHPTGTDKTTLRIHLEPGTNEGMLAAITGATLINPEVQKTVRDFLRHKVDEAKRSAQDEGVVEWGDTLAQLLDYRSWYEIRLEQRFGSGKRRPMTPKTFSELSGGARAIVVMAPLLAALSALYREMPLAPHPLWMDEAFDGLDSGNRSMVMSMLRSFDFDVLLVGPGPLVNVAAVPLAAIYQVVRAPEPLDGATLVLALWSGDTWEQLAGSFSAPQAVVSDVAETGVHEQPAETGLLPLPDEETRL